MWFWSIAPLPQKHFHSNPRSASETVVGLRTPEPEWVEIIGVVAHQRTVSLADPGENRSYLPTRSSEMGPLGAGPFEHREIARTTPRRLKGIQQDEPQAAHHAHATDAGLGRTSAFGHALFASPDWRFRRHRGAAGCCRTLWCIVERSAWAGNRRDGVRMALGAAPIQIFLATVGSGLRLSVIGIGIGIAAALALTRLMISMLIGEFSRQTRLPSR